MNECSCNDCKAACEFKPGWFKPGEAEKVAEYLGLTMEELFKTKLGVDWYENLGDGDVFVLAPAITTMTPGSEYPSNPRGRCIFFKDGLCSIHSVKPFECRESHHSDSAENIRVRHREAAESWIDEQGQIKDILGRTPKSSYYGGSWF